MTRFDYANAVPQSQSGAELFATYTLLALANALALSRHEDLPPKTRTVFGRNFLVIKKALRQYYGEDHDLGEVELWQPAIGKPAIKGDK